MVKYSFNKVTVPGGPSSSVSVVKPRTSEKSTVTVVFLPPMAEQESLLATVDERLATIDTGIRRQHAEINLLAEYRARMIADVVTGKLDVREVVAKLPEEPDELEALHQADMADMADGAEERTEPVEA